MVKAGVILAPGFEESETLYIVDILRRCQISCELVALDQNDVRGAHGIVVVADRQLEEGKDDWTILILPGGYGAVEEMKKSKILCERLRERNSQGKWIGAMCAAPEVLDFCGILEGKKFTAYQGYEHKIHAKGFMTDIVVEDQNLITSRGPACAMHFAFAIAKRLGADIESVKERMLFTNTFLKGEKK